jgi:hypothetical protein
VLLYPLEQPMQVYIYIITNTIAFRSTTQQPMLVDSYQQTTFNGFVVVDPLQQHFHHLFDLLLLVIQKWKDIYCYC